MLTRIHRDINSVLPPVSHSAILFWNRNVDSVLSVSSQHPFSQKSRDELFGLLTVIVSMNPKDRDAAIESCSRFLNSTRTSYPSMPRIEEVIDSIKS